MDFKCRNKELNETKDKQSQEKNTFQRNKARHKFEKEVLLDLRGMDVVAAKTNERAKQGTSLKKVLQTLDIVNCELRTNKTRHKTSVENW